MRLPKQLSESVRSIRIRAGGNTPLYQDHRLDAENAAQFLEDAYPTAPTTYTITTQENGRTVEDTTTGADAAELLTDLSASRDDTTTYTFDSWADDGTVYARMSAAYDEADQPQQLRNQPPLTRQPIEVELATELGGTDGYTADEIEAMLSTG